MVEKRLTVMSLPNRTLQYKTLTIISSIFSLIAYLLMALEWRHKINIWESMYSIGAGFGLGMGLNGQFVGLTACAPAEQQGTAVGVYYLSQQVGVILSVGSYATVFETLFENVLRGEIPDVPSKEEVKYSLCYGSRERRHAKFTAIVLICRMNADW
jgi:hypothetical protein